MRKLKLINLLFIVTIAISSCQKKGSELDYEKKVMNKLFIELIDSLYSEPNYFPPPPAPFPEIYFKTKNQKIKDSIYQKDSLEYIEIIADFEKRVEQIKSYNGKKIIAIRDTIYALRDNNTNLLKEEYSNIEFDLNDGIGYKINLSDYSKNDNYSFKYSSEFPNGNEKWKNNHKTHLKNLISFSRIQFDKTKKYGILFGGISYGHLSGYGFFILIRKESDQWVIDKVVSTVVY